MNRYRPDEIFCLWDGINPVSVEGEVCSYECYDWWISWHLSRNEDIIKIEEGMPVMLPYELQEWYQETWTDRTVVRQTAPNSREW